MKAFEDLGIHPRHAIGRLSQPLAIGVFAHRQQDLPDRPPDSVQVHRLFFPAQAKSPERWPDSSRSSAEIDSSGLSEAKLICSSSLWM